MLRLIISFIILAGTGISSLSAQPGISAVKIKDNSDRILHFASEINIDRSGKLDVVETITIYNGDGSAGFENGELKQSNNNSIERGIFREFPTRHKDSTGFFTDKEFTLLSVLKNGTKEIFAKEKINNGVRVMIGNKDIVLDTGIYQYRIEYRTANQILFLDSTDQLYWNVNGTDWTLSADTVSCLIHFPKGSIIKDNNSCYTGLLGSKDHNCVSQLVNDSSIYFITTQKMGAYEGLTVAIDIRKGILLPPGKFSNILAFIRANYVIPALLFIILFLSAFYFIAWYRKGRDPEKGAIYPVFSPPKDFTPADCGYLLEQRYAPHLFTAAIVDCAVKKQLRIEITREGALFKSNVYHFVKPENPGVASTADVYGFDAGNLYGEIAKKGTYNAVLKSCSDALATTLRDRFLIRKGKQNKVKGLFALNNGYTQFGFFVLLAAVILTILFLVQHVSLKLAIISAVLLVVLFIIHNIFARIMSAYTRPGRDIADQLQGFKMYLEDSGRQDFIQADPSGNKLELFEKYLPYAIALKVENTWSVKFEDTIRDALEQGYTPSYYSIHGGYHGFSVSDISHGISSGFSNTISSASAPPSDSGSGSSGGGSGGGGGGGW